MNAKRWALVVLGTAVAWTWGASGARAGDVEPPPDGKPILGAEQAVLAAQDRRIAATIAGDVAALGAMMTDDLTYTHSSGVEESKAEFLEGLKNGKYLYREITPRGRKVRVHGGAAIVSGPAHIVIEPAGKRTELELYFTELYVKEGDHWRMALWQSTRLPAPAAPAAK
jgi:ketosteroid isomerase-like protein